MISLIVQRKDSLNNKVEKLNSSLINMCGERDTTFVDHTDAIFIEKHLNESKVHLNKSGTSNLLKMFADFHCSRIDDSADNSGNIALGSEKEFDCFRTK